MNLECSNAGQFNTITRRTRRSLEQSYPEDSPSFGYASILSLEATAHYNNNSIVQEEVASSRITQPPLMHVDSSEQQDERIEGLESIMAKMQRTIRVSLLFFQMN